jgi:hypothetical protein
MRILLLKLGSESAQEVEQALSIAECWNVLFGGWKLKVVFKKGADRKGATFAAYTIFWIILGGVSFLFCQRWIFSTRKASQTLKPRLPTQ